MIETKLKDMDRDIRLLSEEGYTVTLHYKQGKYYLEKQLQSETENGKVNKEPNLSEEM